MFEGLSIQPMYGIQKTNDEKSATYYYIYLKKKGKKK